LGGGGGEEDRKVSKGRVVIDLLAGVNKNPKDPEKVTAKCLGGSNAGGRMTRSSEGFILQKKGTKSATKG